LACAHMLRVFIMGAYKPPRELNWVSGVVLFIMTLAFGFTGYLLPGIRELTGQQQSGQKLPVVSL